MSNAQEMRNRYNQEQTEIGNTIQELLDKLESHKQGTNSEPNWSHIGDLVHIKEQLQELL